MGKGSGSCARQSMSLSGAQPTSISGAQSTSLSKAQPVSASHSGGEGLTIGREEHAYAILELTGFEDFQNRFYPNDPDAAEAALDLVVQAKQRSKTETVTLEKGGVVTRDIKYPVDF